MKTLILDLYPTNIPFVIQTTDATGDKTNPSADNLIVYEEGGADTSFDSTEITGSPFDPAQVNSKTGLWGVMIPKSAFTSGRFYIALWEVTVDSVTTAKKEIYFAVDAADFKATAAPTAAANADAVLDELVTEHLVTDSLSVVLQSANNLATTISGSVYQFQKNTARAGFPFPILTAAGELVTGATVAVELTKDGAAFGAGDNSISEISDGWYSYDFSSDDVNANNIGFKGVPTGGSATGIATNFTIVTQP